MADNKPNNNGDNDKEIDFSKEESAKEMLQWLQNHGYDPLPPEIDADDPLRPDWEKSEMIPKTTSSPATATTSAPSMEQEKPSSSPAKTKKSIKPKDDDEYSVDVEKLPPIEEMNIKQVKAALKNLQYLFKAQKKTIAAAIDQRNSPSEIKALKGEARAVQDSIQKLEKRQEQLESTNPFESLSIEELQALSDKAKAVYQENPSNENKKNFQNVLGWLNKRQIEQQEQEDMIKKQQLQQQQQQQASKPAATTSEPPATTEKPMPAVLQKPRRKIVREQLESIIYDVLLEMSSKKKNVFETKTPLNFFDAEFVKQKFQELMRERTRLRNKYEVKEEVASPDGMQFIFSIYGHTTFCIQTTYRGRDYRAIAQSVPSINTWNILIDNLLKANFHPWQKNQGKVIKKPGDLDFEMI